MRAETRRLLIRQTAATSGAMNTFYRGYQNSRYGWNVVLSISLFTVKAHLFSPRILVHERYVAKMLLTVDCVVAALLVRVQLGVDFADAFDWVCPIFRVLFQAAADASALHQFPSRYPSMMISRNAPTASS